MASKSKSQSKRAAAKGQPEATTYKEPKRLSKFALWRRENPEGMFEYVDWEAVNK